LRPTHNRALMEFVQGYENVTSIFGRWPSFHDSKVRLLALEWGERSVDVRMQVHTWASTGETDERGRYRLHKHTLVEMLFSDCAEVQIGGELAVLNILFDLGVKFDSGAERPVQVVLEGIGGLEGSFRCRGAAVVGAEPFEPNQG
jgi:hypothetical protein